MRPEALPRIRRIAHGYDLPEDRAWLAAAFKRYLLAADDGLTLEDALDLATPPHSPTWWQSEAIAWRNLSLRELARLFCPHSSLAQRAEFVAELLSRYASTTWRSDRQLDRLPADAIGTTREIMFSIMKTDPSLVSLRQLRRILAG